MKKIILFIVVCILLGCVKVTTDSIKIEDLLPEKSVNVHIYEKIKLDNPRIIELNKKMQISIQNNYEWYLEYIKNHNFQLIDFPVLFLFYVFLIALKSLHIL